MAPQEPQEVAGLGRPETPAERADRVQKAREERRKRQTIRNLVWSLVASLGVMALLVLVVVRPDTSLVAAIDWRQVASEKSDQFPGEPVVPDLDEQWSANRAEFGVESGSVETWSLGLLGPEQSFVFLDQGFDAGPIWLDDRVKRAPITGTVSLGGAVDEQLVWQEYDRRDVDPTGNRAYVLVYEAKDSTVVIGGTNEQAVLIVAVEATRILLEENQR